MFYVLNFADHSFRWAHFPEEARAIAKNLLETKAAAEVDEIEIVVAADEDRYAVYEFGRLWS